MKYIDYRKRLGLGFDDSKKVKMLISKTSTYFELITEKVGEARGNSCCYGYFLEICEEPRYPYSYDMSGILNNIQESSCLNECICKLITLINVLRKQNAEPFYSYFDAFLYAALEALDIPYEIFEDEDGKFIFPKGAKELDDALVSEPLEWLNAYPQTRKEWIEALKDYSNLTDDNASDVADKFRKALERFFQEFFGKSQSLEKLKSEYGTYLKTQGVPAEISNNFEWLLQSYAKYMNEYAKHHDKTNKNALEYIMYQTGNIIRLLITLRKGENN